MRKSKISIHFNDFLHNSHYYLWIIWDLKNAKIERNYKYTIIEWLSIKVLATWENFCKNVLIDSFHKDTSNYSINFWIKVPKHLPRNVCHWLINWVWFFDIRWFDDLKKLSKKIVIDENNPFLIDRKKILDEIWYIDDFYIYRNFIAHESLKGYLAFKKRLNQKYDFKRIHSPWRILFSINIWEELIIEAHILNFISAVQEIFEYSYEKWLLNQKDYQEIKNEYFYI